MLAQPIRNGLPVASFAGAAFAAPALLDGLVALADPLADDEQAAIETAAAVKASPAQTRR
jgi:hypothetical protein